MTDDKRFKLDEGLKLVPLGQAQVSECLCKQIAATVIDDALKN